MYCVDRTADFATAIESSRAKLLAQHKKVSIPQKRTKPRSEFHNVASNVAQQLASTYDNLERLTLLCKSTSMYGDPAQDIQNLTEDIKHNITSLRDQLSTLQSIQDTKNSQVGAHSETVVKSLTARLQNAKSSFLTVLERRKESLKNQYEKKKQLFGSPSTSSSTSSTVRKDVSSPLYQQTPSNPLITLPSETSGTDVAITIPATMVQSQMLDRRVDSRAEALQDVMISIEELSHIFERVNLLVAQQGELIGRIEDDVELTESRVLTARQQLEKAWESVSSSRWLSLKLGAVGLIFLVIFLVFFA